MKKQVKTQTKVTKKVAAMPNSSMMMALKNMQPMMTPKEMTKKNKKGK